MAPTVPGGINVDGSLTWLVRLTSHCRTIYHIVVKE